VRVRLRLRARVRVSRAWRAPAAVLAALAAAVLAALNVSGAAARVGESEEAVDHLGEYPRRRTVARRATRVHHAVLQEGRAC
jgi:hypothetical protein